MKKNPACFVVVLSLGLLASIPAVSEVRKGDELSVSYGRVDRVDEIKYDRSGIPKGTATGAVVGGLAGSLNASHGHEVRDAAAGALVGALLTAGYKQHKHKHDGGYQYTVRLNGGQSVAVVVEQGGIAAGDCVAVERGESANVRRVSDAHCEHPDHAALKSADVQENAQQAAANCKVAKDAALKARNEEEMDVALKKVRVFCE